MCGAQKHVGQVSGWKGKKIDWRVERPVSTMSKRRLLLGGYGPRESRKTDEGR
jgi:hypothetical protein